jgi:hypothetical protein
MSWAQEVLTQNLKTVKEKLISLWSEGTAAFLAHANPTLEKWLLWADTFVTRSRSEDAVRGSLRDSFRRLYGDSPRAGRETVLFPYSATESVQS